MAHPKGRPKTPGSGRKRGSRNKKTPEVQAIARSFVDDPVYREALKQRLLAGTAGIMEQLLWHYGYGRPTEPRDGSTLPAKITIEF